MKVLVGVGTKKHYCQVVRWNNSWRLLASCKSFAFANSSKCIGNSEKDKIVKFIRRTGSVKSVVSVVTNVGEYESKRLIGCARNGVQSRHFLPAKIKVGHMVTPRTLLMLWCV